MNLIKLIGVKILVNYGTVIDNMEKWELNDERLEKLSQKWAKKTCRMAESKIGYIRSIVQDAYNLGFGDAVDFFDRKKINNNG